MSDAAPTAVQPDSTYPFPESGARRWFRHDGSAWASNGHFAVRLPWIDIGGESFGDDWRELRDPGALFASPFDFAAVRSEDGTDADEPIVDDDGVSYAGKVHDVRRYGRVVLARAYIDAIHTVWPGAIARFSLANNTAAVAFVFVDCDTNPIVGLVAPRRGPDLWVEPDEARRVAHLADEAAHAVDRFAADMRAIAKRVLGGGVP